MAWEEFALEYRVKEADSAAHVSMVGAINEDAELNLQALAGELAGKNQITFNFAQVKSVNSLGVRAWVIFLRSIEEGGRKVIFEECPPDIIMQINMIPSFLGKAKVRSFYTNYVCESCDVTQKVLIDAASLPPKTLPPSQQCPTCKSQMETEELEEEYFAFLMR